MIRLPGTICKNQEALEKRAQQKLNRLALKAQMTGQCPHCRSASLQSWGTYERHVRIMTSDGQISLHLRVPRLYCPHCGHTHSVILPGIVPYRWYGLVFILCVVARYLRRTHSVEAICEHFQIAVSTLYRWVHTARRHNALLCGIMSGDKGLLRLAGSVDNQLLNQMLLRYDQIFLENLR